MRLPRPALAAGLLPLAAAPAHAQQLAYAASESEQTVAAPAADAAEEAKNPPWLQYALLDRFEWSFAHGEDGYAWDFSALLGGDRDRVYVATSGEGASS